MNSTSYLDQVFPKRKIFQLGLMKMVISSAAISESRIRSIKLKKEEENYSHMTRFTGKSELNMTGS